MTDTDSVLAAPHQSPLPDPRLPTTAVPRHYEIELCPDLEAATFTGSVAVDIDIVEATSTIVCNAAELHIESASLAAVLVAADANAPTVLAAAEKNCEKLDFTLDPDAERLTLERKNPDSVFAPGSVRLRISFSGVLNDRLKGFYRSTFTDDDGQLRTIASTQFEATDARRAFPCWDEPSAKATFAVSLVVEDGLLAVSNCVETSRESAGPGKTRVRFATTMPMSTYLVAFVVGPLEVTEPIDAGGVPLRVVHRPGRGAQTAFALEVADHALGWYRDYYGVDYPSDKIDLVAIPDFAFGAMENLGCITFREVLLLVDPASATQAELQRVASVINHELAHMWFGDLVTMAWWEGIWLNEAFAVFMETACTDAFRPEWRMWSMFGRARASALGVDALESTRPVEYPVVTPADAEDMFDVLTYEKGAALVRMLEQYLGAEVFRAGVRLYLRRHAYGNTRTSDLWDALEDASDQPVRAIMDGWINQGGYPVVSTWIGDHGVTLTQRHFTLNPDKADDRLWQVPVWLRIRQNSSMKDDDASHRTPHDGGNEHEHRTLLDRRHRSLTVRPDSVVTANAGASGFFRTNPGAVLLAEVADKGVETWSESSDERHGLVDDAWALTLAGDIEAPDFLWFALCGFVRERDLNVWQALAEALAHIRRILHGAAAERFCELVVSATSGAAADLGIAPRNGNGRRTDGNPRNGNGRQTELDDRTRELRALLLRLRGVVADDSATIDASRQWLDHSDPALASAALSVTASHGNADDFQSIRSRFETATDPQSEQRHLAALADFRDSELVASILRGTLDGTVRTQDGPYLVRRALVNAHIGVYAWTFATSHWTEMTEMFPSNSLSRMLGGIPTLDEPEQAAAVRHFISEHPVPQGAKQIAQHLERLDVNEAFRTRAAAPLAEDILSQ